MSYRTIPLGVRTRLLRSVARLRPAPAAAFPDWPIERQIDDRLRQTGRTISYEGRRSAVVITHDIDSRPELDAIQAIRGMEAPLGLLSAFGFVPEESWPSEATARALVAEGCEVYWHDIGHNGRLPYLGADQIRAAFDQVVGRSPWAADMMHAFRAGQLLVSRDLLSVIAERFAVDMSMPDTERDGPYGGAAGCGTVFPFRYGPLLELPVTMPQEVYLHQVYGYSAADSLRIWLEKLSYITQLGGVAVFNIHPVWISPQHPDMREAFERFLEAVAAMSDVLVTTPTRLASSMTVLDTGGVGG
jgi:hypothetical protein